MTKDELESDIRTLYASRYELCSKRRMKFDLLYSESFGGWPMIRYMHNSNVGSISLSICKLFNIQQIRMTHNIHQSIDLFKAALALNRDLVL